MEKVLGKIENLSQEDLVFYQRLIGFFELLGVDKKMLSNLPNLLKTFPEFVSRINMVIEDQNAINEKFNNSVKEEKIDMRQPFEDLNKEREYLNVYGR
jgi:hypothetical protein